jgi:hypothetical protein
MDYTELDAVSIALAEDCGVQIGQTWAMKNGSHRYIETIYHSIVYDCPAVFFPGGNGMTLDHFLEEALRVL